MYLYPSLTFERAGWLNFEDMSGDYKNYSNYYLFSSYIKEMYKLLKNNKK